MFAFSVRALDGTSRPLDGTRERVGLPPDAPLRGPAGPARARLARLPRSPLILSQLLQGPPSFIELTGRVLNGQTAQVLAKSIKLSTTKLVSPSPLGSRPVRCSHPETHRVAKATLVKGLAQGEVGSSPFSSSQRSLPTGCSSHARSCSGNSFPLPSQDSERLPPQLPPNPFLFYSLPRHYRALFASSAYGSLSTITVSS